MIMIKIFNIMTTLITFILRLIFLYEIFKGNIAAAIFLIGFLAIDYHMWLRGGNSKIFDDTSQIEKDLRKIQKLEIQKKLGR